MIQRIQSVFLLLAAISSGVALLFPFVYFETPTSEILLKAFHYTDIDGVALEEVGQTSALGLILIASALASIITIFLFNKRTVQIRISIYNMLLSIGTLGLIYFYSSYASVEGVSMSIKLGSILPIISTVLIFLAFRAIRRDEAVIKSLDRIR